MRLEERSLVLTIGSQKFSSVTICGNSGGGGMVSASARSNSSSSSNGGSAQPSSSASARVSGDGGSGGCSSEFETLPKGNNLFQC